jgi:S-DNA-T family DNA segregation ATPase FtsK/SpoIIIE
MGQNLRQYLELCSDRVEQVASAHRVQVRVLGGKVGPRVIVFNLELAPYVKLAQVRALAEDFALALRVGSLRIDSGEGGAVMEFANPNPRPVGLLGMLEEAGPLPVSTALLGLAETGKPLMARLSSPDVAHVLVAGTTGSGKSALLRAIAGSLVLRQEPRALRMVCIDPKGRTFQALEGVPHLLCELVTEQERVKAVVRSLVALMEQRDRERVNAPRVVVMIDELADVVMASEAGLEEALTRLVQRGREAGISVIGATQWPSAAVLSGLMRANFPLRIVGRVVSADDARVASGRGGTQAETLSGRGDFLAIAGEQRIRFQGAYVADEELREAVGRLGRIEVPALWREVQEPEVVVVDEMDELRRRLQERVIQERRKWRSLNEAAEWIFGAGRAGGGNFYKARAVVEALEAA